MTSDRSKTLFGAVVLAAVVALALFKIFSFDAWLHLEAGELILERGSVPRLDPFTVLGAGRRWVYHEWLPATAMHLAARAVGVEALPLLKALWLGVTALLLYLVACRRGAPPWLAALLVVCAFVAARFRFNLRPHLVFYFCAALGLYLLERARERPRWLFGLVPLMALWANSHGSFFVGLALIGAAVAATLARERLGFFTADRADERPAAPWPARVWIAALLAALAATLLTPHGLDLWLLPFRIEGMASAKQWITEWRATSFTDWLSLSGGIAALFVVSAVLDARRGARPLFDWLVGLMFIVLAVRAVRFLAPMALLLAPLTAGALGAVLEARRWPGQRSRRAIALGSAALIAGLSAVVVVTNASFHAGERPPFSPGLGLHHGLYPGGAARFVAQQVRTPGAVAAPYNWGAYFIWRVHPGRKVLFDGRAEIYDQRLLTQLARGGHPAPWRALLARSDIAVLVTQNPPDKADTGALLASSWALVFWDDLSRVYLRRTARAQTEITRLALRHAAPDRLAAQPPRGAAACRELERLVKASPYHARSAFWLGRCRFSLGPTHHAAAATALRQSVAVKPTTEAYNGLGAVLQTMGRPDAAARAYRDALSTNAKNPQALYNLASLLWSRRRFDEARTHYREFLRHAPASMRGARGIARARTQGPASR